MQSWAPWGCQEGLRTRVWGECRAVWGRVRAGGGGVDESLQCLHVNACPCRCPQPKCLTVGGGARLKGQKVLDPCMSH